MSEVNRGPELLPVERQERVVLSDAERNRPIWELICARAEAIPESELEQLPADGAENHDTYLYGAPRKGSR